MHMVRGQHPLDDRDPNFLTNLPRNLEDALPDRATQHLVTVLGNPDEEVEVMIKFVFTLKLSV